MGLVTEEWRLSEWKQEMYIKNIPAMTPGEIKAARAFLRRNGYPKPADCPMEGCPKFRPACKMNICHIAVKMCGDF